MTIMAVDALRVPFYSSRHSEGHMFREISLIREIPVIIGLISKEHRTLCTVWLSLY
jgi:hypothetical protein